MTAHFPAYDGNGKVTALVDTSGATTASYEYSPFGVLLRCEGEAARANPFRFSSKFTDEETGLLYYGYRYYSTTLGRWISKDPIEEEGGLNLYAFCENNSISGYDLLGQMLLADVAGTNGGQASEKAWEIERGNSFIGWVREWVETMNEIQGFIEDVMDSVEGDSDDLLISLFEMGRSVAGNGLKMFAGDSGDDDSSAGGGMAFSAMRSGWKAPSHENHHPYSREFASKWNKAGINWKKLTKRVTYRLHRQVIHGGSCKGGWWNTELRKFFEKDRTPAEMQRKVEGMMKKVGIDRIGWN